MDDATNNFLNIEDQPNTSRYHLRRRGPNQLKPYTVEKFQYKQALISNPDAIVKFRSPPRNRSRAHNPVQDDAEESQELWMPDERDLLDDVDNGNHDLHNALDVTQYPEILQDLPLTDEEEADELRALSREARIAVRQQRRAEQAEKELLKRKQKLKPFPLRPEVVLNVKRKEYLHSRPTSTISLVGVFSKIFQII